MFFSKKLYLEGLISIIMHDLCVFCTICTFAQKIFKGWGCYLKWSFGMVMRNKSLKMVFVARIMRHKLCMIHAFFVCSKIIAKGQKLFSYCWDKFDYPGSIVCLSCFAWNLQNGPSILLIFFYWKRLMNIIDNFSGDFSILYYYSFYIVYKMSKITFRGVSLNFEAR